MSGRPQGQLSEAAKELLRRRLLRSRERVVEASRAEKIDIYEAWQLGMTTREIGAVYGVDATTANRWKNEGEALVREQST